MSTENVKIAVPCSSNDGLDAQVNSRFGRCEFFTIVTVSNKTIVEVNVIQNPGINAMGGAGPLAAQTVAQEGVSIVAGANFGPNAANALTQGNIQTFGYPGEVTVKELIQQYLNGELNQISGSNVASHTGMQKTPMGKGMGRGRN